jgi:endonuclease YncB( thermonuclease family)
LDALDAQNEVVKQRGVRQTIRVYGIDAGNQHHDNGVVWRTIDVYMFKDESAHVLRYIQA